MTEILNTLRYHDVHYFPAGYKIGVVLMWIISRTC